MTSTTSPNSLITRLTINDISSISSLLQNAFSDSYTHSLSRSLGVPSPINNYIENGALNKPIQFKIGCYGEKVSNDSNQYKGIIITEELESPQQVSINKIELEEKEEFTAYDIIDSLIIESKLLFYNELHRRHFHRTEKYKCAYIPWIATDELYRHQGVAKRLIQIADEQMLRNGYDCSVVICSDPMSTKVFQIQGYEIWEDIEYKTFRFDDETYPFVELPDSCNVLVKELNPQP